MEQLNPGLITGDQDVCQGAQTVTTLASTNSASGGTQGSYSYQWQVSTDQSTWSDISGATGLTYTPSFPSGFSQTTYYRRGVKNADVWAYTLTPVTLQKVNKPNVSIASSSVLNSNLSTTAPIIPNGASITLTASATGTGVVNTWSWSPTSGLTVSNAAGTQAYPSSTTTYTVTGSTTGGCSNTSQITVTVD